MTFLKTSRRRSSSSSRSKNKILRVSQQFKKNIGERTVERIPECARGDGGGGAADGWCIERAISFICYFAGAVVSCIGRVLL